MNFSNLFINCLFKFERVQGFECCFELFFRLFRDVFGFKDSLVGSFRFVVVFDRFGSDTFFGHELDGRDEKVVVEAPFGFVKVIE